VLEVLAGIVVGPQVLGLVRAQGAAEVLYLLGLGFLLFLAGQDVRPERFRGPTFRLAGTAFAVSLVLAVPVAFGLHVIAPGADVRLLALCLVASTLGVLVPVLRDAEGDHHRVRPACRGGWLGRREFGSCSLLPSVLREPQSTVVRVIYVLAMGVAALVLALILRWLWRTGDGGVPPTPMRDDPAAGPRARRRPAAVHRAGPPVRRGRAAGGLHQ
jgi:Kef-type K+ transport system membrane component KefB